MSEYPKTAYERGDTYDEWYTRGWSYSGRPSASLEHGDSRHYPDAWYDGYYDRAAGREKWNTPDVKAVEAALTRDYYRTTADVMRRSGLSRTRAMRALRAAEDVHEYPTDSGTYWGYRKEQQR